MKTLGAIGTLVWDRLWQGSGASVPVEGWGGIAYSIAALSATLPETWVITPIVKVGADMAEGGARLISALPRVDPRAMLVATEPNNRVELRYQTAVRRTERLSGGVPPWTWAELAARVSACDALYVNFVSGFEMDLETAAVLARAFDGPKYADLHSLFLGIDEGGRRVPRTLEKSADWLRCFDAVQINEIELELFGDGEDPWRRARRAIASGLELFSVTLGRRGAAYLAASCFEPDPFSWGGGQRPPSAECRGGRVPLEGDPEHGDPTGCGDVWGATTFARLLRGDSLEEAMAVGNRFAALNVRRRGAGGLHEDLVASRSGEVRPVADPALPGPPT